MAKQNKVEMVEAVEAATWVPMPKYGKTVDNALARRDAYSAEVFVGMGRTAPPRAGTASFAVWATLDTECRGLSRAAVLAKCAEAEREWHKAANRTPGNVAPAGWLRTFGAVFE